MNLALDTNAYSAFTAGNTPTLKKLLDHASQILIPYIVDAELRAGFQKGRKKDENYTKLSRFHSLDRVDILWPNEKTNQLYAQIWAELSTRGTPIPTNDVWIAALCLEHNLPLVSNDAHFSKVSFLGVMNF